MPAVCAPPLRRARAALARASCVGVVGLVGVAGIAGAGCGGEDGDRDLATEVPTEVSVVSPDGSPVTFQASAPATTAGSQTSGPPAATIAVGTLAPVSAPASSAPATLPGTTVAGSGAPTTSAAPAGTAAPATPAPTTIAATSPPPTMGAPVCDLAVVIEQTETEFEGITPGQLACAGTWVAWAGVPDDPLLSDGYFAVAEWTGSAWQLRNLGTAGVCEDAGVPANLWPALGCVE